MVPMSMAWRELCLHWGLAPLVAEGEGYPGLVGASVVRLGLVVGFLWGAVVRACRAIDAAALDGRTDLR